MEVMSRGIQKGERAGASVSLCIVAGVEMAEKGRVCVTGAGGFIASWLVKLLLSNGYSVNGTVRDPDDKKNDHLKKLENAAEKLLLFKVNLLDYDSVHSAIEGCDGVFHVASPVPSSSVPNPEIELVEPAAKGTLNVLMACSEVKVKRVVVVSSIAAITLNPSWPKDKMMDENCWSDEQYCKTTENWYCFSKTVAERDAYEYSAKNGLDLITVCPSFVLGPLLQPTINSSSLAVIKLLKGGQETCENKHRLIVDVRDVAEALLLTYEKQEATGRYICSSHQIKVRDKVEILRSLYPNYNYPKKYTEVKDDNTTVSSEKLQRLGWKYRPLKETLADSVQCYEEAGLLNGD